MEKSASNDFLRVQKNKTVILPPFYLAPVEYYSKLFHADSVIIESCDNYQKQSYRNRCNIVGANGLMSLSIPVEKGNSPQTPMKEIRISDHGNWRHIHWNAIVSAYNSTPFFEYYEDDFRLFYEKKFEFLFDFNEQLRALIFKLLSIDVTVVYSEAYIESYSDDFFDFRESIHPKRKSDFAAKPYHQVFGQKNGFIENASIIDMLFNIGNESRLYL